MSESANRPSWPWALLAFALLSAGYWTVAIKTPLAIGFWQDDATYVATAHSLAEGNGYRHIQTPGAPLQTHYPPLYSALLSLGFRVSPGYPENLPWLLLPGALGAAALVTLSIAYWRRVFDPPDLLWRSAAGLAALSPVLLAFVRYTMSDLVYAGLVIAALLCLDGRRVDESSEEGRDRRFLVLGAVLVGFALLTRAIGISLLLAMPAALLLRRRFAEAALSSGIAALICIPWWIWQAWASGQNGPMQHAFLTASELSYGIWAPESLAQSLGVIGQNLLRALHDLAYYQLALPIGFANEATIEPGWKTAALFVACSITLMICVIGFLQSTRGGWRTLHLYALLYAGLLIAWPFEPHRLMIPWTPTLLYFILAGAWASTGWGVALAGRVSTRDGAAPASRSMAWQASFTSVLAALIAISFVVEDSRIITSRPDRYFVRELPDGVDLREFEEVYAWVREHIPEDGLVSAASSGGLFLNTGRRGYFVWPDSNPYARYYGPDREAWRFYGARSQSEATSISEEMMSGLLSTYNEAGIQYYLDQPHWLESRVMRAVIESNPTLFEELFESSNGSYRVYRLKFPTSPAEAT